MNKKYKKEIFNVWLNKTDSKELQNAIADDDFIKAQRLFKIAFSEGLVEKR